jgi:hypothetical protein
LGGNKPPKKVLIPAGDIFLADKGKAMTIAGLF